VNRKVDWTVVALLLLAAAVRFPGLGERSLWFDEALSGAIARLDTVQVLTNVVGSSHPPGYYFILHLWRTLSGSDCGQSGDCEQSGEFALRFPSAWCSLAAAALVARLGHDLFGRRVARLAALGMAWAPFQVYYAQEARMYGVAVALSSSMIWMFIQAIREGNRGIWWCYGLFAVLGLYVHYYIALVMAALHVWLLLDRKRMRQVLMPLLVSDVLIVLAFAPQLAQFRVEAGEFLGSARWRVAPHPLEPLRTLHYLLFSHVMPLWIVPMGLFLIIGVLAIGVLWVWRRRDSKSQMLILIVFLPIIFVLCVSLLVTPVYVERSFAVVTPALMLLLARSVVVAPRRSPVPYLGTLLVILMATGTGLYHIQDDPAKPPLRDALAIVAQQAEVKEGILHLQDASYLTALYYEPGTAGALMDVGQRLWLSPEAYALFGGRVIRSDDYIPSGRVWLMTMPGYMDPPQRAFLDKWEGERPAVQSWDWDGAVQVRLYAWEE
jgi:mannosyltransferase